MTPSATWFVLWWLFRDTFRQALASRTFWLMLSISGLCILLCLSAGVEGGPPVRLPGDIELYGADNQPLTGPNPDPGYLTLGFGTFRWELHRDAEAEVRFLQTLLAIYIAGTVGTVLALVFTAGFLPSFLEPSAAAVLLAKPVPRWLLLAGKTLGVLLFVAFQAVIFFVGTWFALGIRTGVWPAGYLVGIPLLLLNFTIAYSFSVLLAVSTRSAVAAIFGSLLFWAFCYAMNYGRHAALALPYDSQASPFQSTWMIEGGYWVLPKPADLVMILNQALEAGKHFALPEYFQVIQDRGLFQPALSVLASFLFAACLFLAAAWEFKRADY
jgi:ABC-type transport system involved in multi-copper enzyme maturation permease subunit